MTDQTVKARLEEALHGRTMGECHEWELWAAIRAMPAMKAALSRLAALEAENRELLAALKAHGSHLMSCEKIQRGQWDTHQCTCGLNAFLAPPSPSEGAPT